MSDCKNACVEIIDEYVDKCVDECLYNLKPDLPDECLAYVIVYGGYAETVILGTWSEAESELAIFNKDCKGDTAHLEYVELIDRR